MCRVFFNILTQTLSESLSCRESVMQSNCNFLDPPSANYFILKNFLSVVLIFLVSYYLRFWFALSASFIWAEILWIKFELVENQMYGTLKRSQIPSNAKVLRDRKKYRKGIWIITFHGQHSSDAKMKSDVRILLWDCTADDGSSFYMDTMEKFDDRNMIKSEWERDRSFNFISTGDFNTS